MSKTDRSRVPMNGHREIDRVIPCNGCTACCEQELLVLHYEDDPADFKIQCIDGTYALAQKLNGDCFYLARGQGCTIWNRRPSRCRGLDCRAVLLLGPRAIAECIRDGLISKKQVRAARKLKCSAWSMKNPLRREAILER